MDFPSSVIAPIKVWRSIKRLRSIHLKKGLGSHLGNKTTASVPALIPIESSKMYENIRIV